MMYSRALPWARILQAWRGCWRGRQGRRGEVGEERGWSGRGGGGGIVGKQGGRYGGEVNDGWKGGREERWERRSGKRSKRGNKGEGRIEGNGELGRRVRRNACAFTEWILKDALNRLAHAHHGPGSVLAEARPRTCTRIPQHFSVPIS